MEDYHFSVAVEKRDKSPIVWYKKVKCILKVEAKSNQECLHHSKRKWKVASYD